MQRDESEKGSAYLDRLTGVPSTITGANFSGAQRAACTALNRERAGGITQVREEAQRREQVQADVWRHVFTGRLTEWEVPIIPLEKMGVRVEFPFL